MEKEESTTMWPEKIDIIYLQFPWLWELYPKEKVGRAYVKRFNENTLDIVAWKIAQNGVRGYLVGGSNYPWFKQIGKKTTSRRNVFSLFLKYRHVEYFNQSVRDAIQHLPEGSQEARLVVIQDEGNEIVLTIFKPPQNGVALKQWYIDKVAAINKEMLEEIEKT